MLYTLGPCESKIYYQIKFQIECSRGKGYIVVVVVVLLFLLLVFFNLYNYFFYSFLLFNK